jgi:hypothetical protein
LIDKRQPIAAPALCCVLHVREVEWTITGARQMIAMMINLKRLIKPQNSVSLVLTVQVTTK